MPWVKPVPLQDGQILTAAYLNNMVRNNMMMTCPGVATSPHRYFVTAERNTVREAQWVRAYSGPAVTTSSSTPDDLEDEGPSVTFEHGGAFFVLFDARVSTVSGVAVYSPEVVGEDSGQYGASWLRGFRNQGDFFRSGSHVLHYGLNPGLSTVRMMYWNTSGGESTFAQRRLSVLPL